MLKLGMYWPWKTLWSHLNFQVPLHMRIHDLGDMYANLIKSRCTLGQILIMCLNYLLKNCIFYKKKFVGTLIYTKGQNQCQKINNGLLPALFWLTNIKHRIKLVIMQWSWHYWKRRKQFLWKSGDRVLIFTAGFEFLLGQTNIQCGRKERLKSRNLKAEI